MILSEQKSAWVDFETIEESRRLTYLKNMVKYKCIDVINMDLERRGCDVKLKIILWKL